MALKLWSNDSPEAGGKQSQAAGGVPKAEGEDKALTDADLIDLAKQLHAIVQGAVDEHSRWSQGFFEWRGNLLQNMQQIPPQAQFDYANRLKWMMDFIQKFSAPAAILSKAGHKELGVALAALIDDYKKLAATFESTSQAMQADDAATALALGKIGGNIMRDNALGAAERHRLQQDAANFVQNSNDQIMKDRRETSERHHGQVSQFLKY